MASNLVPHSPRKAAVIAQRLRAHARLCEQVAHESWNEDTAANFRRMAADCTRMARRIAREEDGRDNPPQMRH
jgi:hypothetical protein